MDKKDKPWLVPEYLSEVEVAVTLGRSRDWLRKNLPDLERAGFPSVDGLIGLTGRQDVQAWIKRRRRVADVSEAEAKENSRADAPISQAQTGTAFETPSRLGSSLGRDHRPDPRGPRIGGGVDRRGGGG